MRKARELASARDGSSAVEFAIIAPIFILTLMTLIAYGIYLAAAHSIQQLAADAARTAVAGVSNAEREKFVKTYIDRSTIGDGFVNRKNLVVAVTQDPANSNQFTVSLAYDASNLPIWNLFSYALPDEVIRRFATIRMGGI
ncbi:TadE/TadG family type IV pilus assembly protein [Rhizobium sp. RAF56]|jgi:Flp pilus assembly protein TadG|uniref:TadE/TadG family type IV pilus assembly protein n=1 Tax=Rhizobium sp. RAF56 TaxID=3233062 RepID=UPI003F99B195